MWLSSRHYFQHIIINYLNSFIHLQLQNFLSLSSGTNSGAVPVQPRLTRKAKETCGTLTGGPQAASAGQVRGHSRWTDPQPKSTPLQDSQASLWNQKLRPRRRRLATSFICSWRLRPVNRVAVDAAPIISRRHQCEWFQDKKQRTNWYGQNGTDKMVRTKWYR